MSERSLTDTACCHPPTMYVSANPAATTPAQSLRDAKLPARAVCTSAEDSTESSQHTSNSVISFFAPASGDVLSHSLTIQPVACGATPLVNERPSRRRDARGNKSADDVLSVFGPVSPPPPLGRTIRAAGLSRLRLSSHEAPSIETPPPPRTCITLYEQCCQSYEESVKHPPTPLSAALGTFIGLGGLVLAEPIVQRLHPFNDHTLLFIGSFGALATLLYGSPTAPLGRTRNVIYGHVVSLLVAFSVHAISHVALPRALGGSGPHLTRDFEKVLVPSLAIGAMVGLGVSHPPAAACVVIYTDTAADLRWQSPLFLLSPALLGAVWMLLVQYLLARAVWLYTTWAGQVPVLPRYTMAEQEAASSAAWRASVRRWLHSFSAEHREKRSATARPDGTPSTPPQDTSTRAIKHKLSVEEPEMLRRVCDLLRTSPFVRLP